MANSERGDCDALLWKASWSSELRPPLARASSLPHVQRYVACYTLSSRLATLRRASSSEQLSVWLHLNLLAGAPARARAGEALYWSAWSPTWGAVCSEEHAEDRTNEWWAGIESTFWGRSCDIVDLGGWTRIGKVW